MNRRGFLAGLGSAIAAPALVRSASLEFVPRARLVLAFPKLLSAWPPLGLDAYQRMGIRQLGVTIMVMRQHRLLSEEQFGRFEQEVVRRFAGTGAPRRGARAGERLGDLVGAADRGGRVRPAPPLWPV